MSQMESNVKSCPICVEENVQLYQCCPNVLDSLCEDCWKKTIDSTMDKGRIAALFNGELTCEFCRQPIDRQQLPDPIRNQLENLLLTIPKTIRPTSVEDFSYKFDENGELRHCVTGDKFRFLTQRHYNYLGEQIDKYIQKTMKEDPWNYREIWLPIRSNIDNDDHHDQVNIFVSDDFETNENGCLILIQGSGVVRPGQWARSCCINESLDIGAMFPYMKKAKENHLSVIILNPNQTSFVDSTEIIDESDDIRAFYLSSDPLPRRLTTKIEGLATNREHILYVYDQIISRYCRAKNLYVVAHSAGGDGLMFLLRKRSDEILKKLTKIAFTDSVHSVLPVESNEIRTFLRAKAIHFVASDQPMGESIDSGYDFYQRAACEEVSAGHPKHEYTSGYCVEGVFRFFFPIEDKTNEQEDEEENFERNIF